MQYAFPNKVLMQMSPTQLQQRVQQLWSWMKTILAVEEINSCPELHDFFLESTVIKVTLLPPRVDIWC